METTVKLTECPFSGLCGAFFGAACCPENTNEDCKVPDPTIKNCPRCDQKELVFLPGAGETVGCKKCGFVMILVDSIVRWGDIPLKEYQQREKTKNWNLFDPTPFNQLQQQTQNVGLNEVLCPLCNKPLKAGFSQRCEKKYRIYRCYKCDKIFGKWVETPLQRKENHE